MVTDTARPPAGAARIWTGGLSAAALLGLIAMMAVAARRPTEPQLDPAVWWYVARAAGLIAWALLGAAVVGGMALATQLAGRRIRSWAQGLHEFVAVLAIVFTMVHLASILAADELRIGLTELVVPFAREANPVAQGCGVLASYLLIAVVVTSWMRQLLPWRWWRRLHQLSFPLFALACVHAVLAGTDIGHPALQWGGLLLGSVIVFLVTFRLLTAQHRTVPAAAPISTPTSTAGPHPPPPEFPAPRQLGMSLLVQQATWEAENVLSLRLTHPNGAQLPRWEPGAHIELALPSGLLRQYSLCGDPGDRRSYRIAVLHASTGRGGSREIHTVCRVGDLMNIQGPRNNFPLISGSAYLFIAGGIGITAMLAMASEAAASDANWQLIYGGRSRAAMAFINEARALDPDRVELVPQDECGLPDLDATISCQAPGTAVYCCGPEPLIRAVEDRIQTRPELSLHIERFAPAVPAGGAAFQVELRRTGTVVDVAADQTILQAVRNVLPTVPSGCEQGICGACRTTVLAGEPDHRDTLLSDTERADRQILICVSRTTSSRLTLDL